MASVKDYYPGDFWGDIKQTLAWLYARQNAPIGGWQGNALATATTPQLAQCGIVSTADFSGAAQTAVENIVIDPPAGVLPDASPAPDGFPVNFSPMGLPTGNVLLNTFQNTMTQAVSGRCMSLLQPVTNYRVDVFSRTDQFYYQGSAPLASLGGGSATWGPLPVAPGAVIAVLYPATTPLPVPGSYSTRLPAGWVAHSNVGVGPRLSSYFARIYSRTDIEYLQEDNVPVVVQDAHHARCGSSVVPGNGRLTVHVVYNDPVVGPTAVFTSLQNLAAFRDLPRSFEVPTSDPLYVPDVTASNTAALQNRSFIYDDALAIVAYSMAGNFTAASKVVKQLNYFLDHPAYLASQVLEDAEDGSVSRWAKSSPGDTVTNLNDPAQPPYGAGNVIQFYGANAGDYFTYVGSGFPDSNDAQIQFQHREDATVPFVFGIGVTTAGGAVAALNVTSDAVGPATFDPGARTITIPVGLGHNSYRTNLVNAASLISTLAGDTLRSITSFSIVLNAGGNLYYDNLSVGNTQPQDSLGFSYDIYNGQVDQAYIRTGAMAWVCYAYAIYMAMSLDYSPALYLQRMLNFLLGLQSPAADLTQGLLYLGYGKYQDPGYQFVPGLQAAVSTEHNIDTYFAFKRAARILPTAAVQLLKTGAITSAQSVSLNSTAATVSSAAEVVAAALTTNLYIPPGSDPGHFAQGASASGLDASQALDAGGTWSALFCHAAGDDAKAAECLKFVYQKFYLQGEQILLSSASASYNQAYRQTQRFAGFKPYNDSVGGYAGSPAAVWQEGTWGMITALLRSYNVPGVASYFAGVEGSLDAFLSRLVSGQRAVRSTTGDGSIINYSLASRGLPYEFAVWPSFSATAWFWITAMNPGILLATDTDPESLPYLFAPTGQSQTVSELDGQTSIGNLQVEAIDPAGVLKGLAAQQNLIGRVARFRMGFPAQALGDFTTLHTVQIVSTGFTVEGRMTFTCADVQRFMQSSLLWTNGGPSSWTAGQPVPPAPPGKAFAPNAYPTSDKNPRWIQGNPLDIYLVAMQNELGVGQDPSLPPSAWTIYTPGQDSTLINPNPYLDVAGLLALRDGPFSGDWFEFKITRPPGGKQWLEDQILKVLGLYTLVRADGRLTLKSMSPPSSLQPALALNEKNIIGIPEVSRLAVVNVVTARMSTDDTDRETAARQYQDEVTFVQASSVDQYKQQYQHQVESDGLRLPYGGMLRAFLLASRIFRRHAFGTPQYRVKAFLSTAALELGDFVWLNHPLVPDFASGGIGLTNVICEVIDRQPDYSKGCMQFTLLDTRFMNLTPPCQLASFSAQVPAYAEASAAQRSEYMYISVASSGGLNPDGTPGGKIF